MHFSITVTFKHLKSIFPNYNSNKIIFPEKKIQILLVFATFYLDTGRDDWFYFLQAIRTEA